MKFWKLGSPESSANLATWNEEVESMPPIHCAAYPGHQRWGGRKGALSVDLKKAPAPDVVWTWVSDCLVREELKDIFQQERITGVEFVDARTRYAKPSSSPPPKLYELVVTGFGGAAPKASGIRLWRERSCEVCGHKVFTVPTDVSRLVDESQWDGSDVFLVWPLPLFRLCTERVVDLFQKHEITGVRFTPVEEIRLTGGDTLAPGKALNFYPEPQARILEDAFPL